jgi:type II secretory ATPase GspE/PulE/Tfp pilus assembly ATPase PilB-like protein
MPEVEKEIKNIGDLKKKIEAFLPKSVTDVLEIIFGGAINLEASDIHLEPEKDKAKLRIRIDGILQDVIFLDKIIYESILSRIKLLSGLKFNISDRPQDGRFSVLLKGASVEIRSSVIPAQWHDNCNRSDGLWQNHDAVCFFKKDLQPRNKNNYYRRPNRIPPRRCFPNPGFTGKRI